MTPSVIGVLETALYVGDLERSTHFYKTIFDFEVILSDPRIRVLNVAGRQVLLLFKKGASTEPVATPGGIIPPNDGSGELHLAFAISSGDLEPWETWLAKNNIAIESKVKWPRGGHSIYFRDPDRHLIELATPGIWPIY
jgi:catechol 2,3-dioxygenase-like lactoylglutathione lyase family enzyme